MMLPRPLVNWGLTRYPSPLSSLQVLNPTWIKKMCMSLCKKKVYSWQTNLLQRSRKIVKKKYPEQLHQDVSLTDMFSTARRYMVYHYVTMLQSPSVSQTAAWTCSLFMTYTIVYWMRLFRTRIPDQEKRQAVYVQRRNESAAKAEEINEAVNILLKNSSAICNKCPLSVPGRWSVTRGESEDNERETRWLMKQSEGKHSKKSTGAAKQPRSWVGRRWLLFVHERSVVNGQQQADAAFTHTRVNPWDRNPVR